MRWCWGCWKIRCSSFDSKLEFHGTLEINVLKDNAKIMFLKLFFFCGNREKTVEDVVRRCQRGHHALIDNKCLNVSLPADEYFLYLINNRWLETANCFRFSCFFFSRSSSPWGFNNSRAWSNVRTQASSACNPWTSGVEAFKQFPHVRLNGTWENSDWVHREVPQVFNKCQM